MLERSCERSGAVKKRWTLLIIFALSLTGILWITLFSRIGSESRSLYPPLWSYRAIANGSIKALLENFGNIVLFIPVGVIAIVVLHLRVWQAALLGFVFSLLIEGSQWLFWLGSFEVDDLINNAAGTVIGAVAFNNTRLGKKIILAKKNRKNNTIFLMSFVVIMIVLPLSYHAINHVSMKKYAALNNRDDGTENLLILNGEAGYISDTDMYVLYNDDGSLTIRGATDKRAWKLLGFFTLKPGKYLFAGLSGTESESVAIELEYYRADKGKFVRLTPDIGPIDETTFILESNSRIKALIGVYPGATGEYTARPVIYREDY